VEVGADGKSLMPGRMVVVGYDNLTTRDAK
jgi:hypothetical protein